VFENRLDFVFLGHFYASDEASFVADDYLAVGFGRFDVG